MRAGRFEGIWWLPEDPDNEVSSTLEIAHRELGSRSFSEARNNPRQIASRFERHAGSAARGGS
jgi:hypothetical protein